MLDRLGPWISTLGKNAVPIGGLVAARWATPTALALYWFESLVGALFNLARIAIHRSRTHKRGHFRAQLGVRAGGRQLSTFLAEYAVGSLVFTLTHGLFLALILFGLLHASFDPRSLGFGVVALVGFEAIGFASDLAGIAARPFAWIRDRAGSSLGRVILLHLVIILGGGLVVVSGKPQAILYGFAGVKLLVDLAGLRRSAAAASGASDEPPDWVQAMGRKLGLKPGKELDAWWEQHGGRQALERRRDEETMPT